MRSEGYLLKTRAQWTNENTMTSITEDVNLIIPYNLSSLRGMIVQTSQFTCRIAMNSLV